MTAKVTESKGALKKQALTNNLLVKIVYKDERKCNAENILQSKIPEFKKVENYNKMNVVLETTAGHPKVLKTRFNQT